MTPGQVELELCGVVHLVRPAGAEVRDLEELRVALRQVPERSLFFHSAGRMLRHPASAELPHDDVSAWVGGVVQDAETAERLSFEVQNDGESPAALQQSLLRVLEAVPLKHRLRHDAPEGSPFRFLSATSLSYPMDVAVHDDEELVHALLAADAGVWFFHLIEEPFYQEGRAPLLEWVTASGHERHARWLAESARAAVPIDKARARFVRRWRQSRIGRRLAQATRLPEEARREMGREAMARLVRGRPSNGDGT
ncbi:MAG TPA: DUF5752 family protein [Dongiaceae bacterium]|nr:DUF5752 family protein [Dongiaceae bacterium]